MEHQPTENILTNFILATTTIVSGFISINFGEALKEIDLILSPLVKLASLGSFIFFIILNYDNIKTRLTKIKDKLKRKPKTKKN